MDNNYAEATCVLKVNIHCHSCKMRIVEVLSSICGEYSFEINTDEGLVKIFALVDPNLLMKALSRAGNHAELKSVRLQHPRVTKNYYANSSSGGYGSYGGGYSHGGALEYYPQQQGIGYNSHSNYYPPTRGLPDPYSSYPSNNYYPTQPYYQGGSDPYYPADPYGHGPGASPARWAGGCNRPRPFAGYY